MDVVCLGCREQDAVDAAGDQSRNGIAVSLSETGEDVGQRSFEVGNRCRSCVQCAERIDEDDLTIETCEVVAEERPDNNVLVRFVAALQHA